MLDSDEVSKHNKKMEMERGNGGKALISNEEITVALFE